MISFLKARLLCRFWVIHLSGYRPIWIVELLQCILPTPQWCSVLVLSLWLRALQTGHSFYLTQKATVTNTVCFVSLIMLLAQVSEYAHISVPFLVIFSGFHQSLIPEYYCMPDTPSLFCERGGLSIQHLESLYTVFSYSHHVSQVTPHWSLTTGWLLFLKCFWSTLLIEHEEQLSLSMLFASLPPFLMFKVRSSFSKLIFSFCIYRVKWGQQ